MNAVPELLEIDFVAQFRFPTPAAYAARRISLAGSELERRQAIVWAAELLGRTLGSFVQADRQAAAGGPPVPADAAALRWQPQPDPFIRELELPWIGARGLSRLVEETGLDDPVDRLLFRIRHLARQLQFLARYRLVVVQEGGRGSLTQAWVFMGPEEAIPVWLRGGGDLPRGVPLLVDPRDGRFLTLAPYLVYVDQPRRLDLFTGVEHNEARYMAADGSVAYLVPHPGDDPPRRGRADLDEGDAHLLTDPTCVLDDGVVFADDYRIIGWMARGGVAEIYLAHNLRSDHLSAIKLFVPDDNLFDRNLVRFIDEGNFRDRFETDSVIRIFRKDAVGNYRYMEMEYLPGGDLAEQMRRGGPLPASTALDIADQVLEALQVIHGAGVVHRDIKPGNVLFTWDRSPRLIDLGIARNLPAAGAPATSTGRLGTEGYMAPEQARGGRVDERTDIYGVGVLLHEMITGLRPDQVDDAGVRVAVPRGLETIIARCLAYDPDRRHPDARTLRRELRAWRLRPGNDTDPVAISLDLEGTLITNALEAVPRPGLSAFMDWCHGRFDRLFVYTCVEEQRARDILSQLVWDGHMDAAVADRMEVVRWSRGFDGARKDLRRCGVPVECNVIVDDMRMWIVPDQMHRWLECPDYDEPDPTDRFLSAAPGRIEHLLSGSSAMIAAGGYR